MSQGELTQDEPATIAPRMRFVYFSIVFAFICAFVRTDLSLTIAAMFVLAMLSLIVCLLALSSRDLPRRLDPALRAAVR